MDDRDLTALLNAAAEDGADDALVERLHGELSGMARGVLAREPVGGTLSATALVHEVWLRVVRQRPDGGWDDRGHFFGAAANAMRRMLIDQSRRRRTRSERLGRRLDLERIDVAGPSSDELLLAVDDALEHLATLDAEMVRIVELKFFAGMTMPEIAARLAMPLRTVELRWTHARAWLRARIDGAR